MQNFIALYYTNEDLHTNACALTFLAVMHHSLFPGIF
jgi:hypothetical protein